MSRAADLDEIMYNCGLEMLHPGGLEKTDEMARICQIGADKTLLDIGAGRGASSCYLARKYRCYVIGIDPSERMIRACQERAARAALEFHLHPPEGKLRRATDRPVVGPQGFVLFLIDVDAL